MVGLMAENLTKNPAGDCPKIPDSARLKEKNEK